MYQSKMVVGGIIAGRMLKNNVQESYQVQMRGKCQCRLRNEKEVIVGPQLTGASKGDLQHAHTRAPPANPEFPAPRCRRAIRAKYIYTVPKC